MKKLLSFFTLFLLLLTFGYAQIVAQLNNNTPTVEECGFDIRHQQLMSTDPLYRQNTEDFNLLMSKGGVQNKAGTVYRVPVVVHIMYKGEAVGTGSNISDASIQQGILQLNERFRKVPGSLGDGNGVDVEIEFALAVRDESDNCTDGIVRYDMSSYSNYMNYGMNYFNSNGMDESTLKALSRWDPNEYYNIYLVYEIDDNEGGNGIQGFAYFASSHGNSVDGMIQLTGKFAESGNTTLTHELGHAMNIYHTFQGDGGGSSCPNGQGDYCADTPKHKRSPYNCVTATNTCTGGSSSEHIHNYMDYSSDVCQSEFTADQKTRAQTALTTTRNSFLESNGNLSLVPPLPPTVEFSASTTAICLGTSVSFYDESTCIPNTYQNGPWTNITFEWTFDDGVNPPTTSTDQNPLITFVNAGTYSVKLVVINASGSDSLTKSSYVSVAAGTPTAACTPGSQNGPGNYGYTLSNLTLESINNTTSSGTNGVYTDYTCNFATSLTVDSTYNLYVTLNTTASNSEDVEVYIDYNDDGSFTAGELVMSKTLAAGGGSQTYMEPITIPGTAVTGKILRMRAHADANGVGTLCNTTYVGDIEDYGVFINAAVSCTDPDVPTLSSAPSICSGANTNISVTSGNLNDATAWQWYTVSCGGTPAGSGVTINVSPSVTTTYYVRGEGGCVTPGTCASIIVTVNDVPGNAGAITGSTSECENVTGIPYSITAVSGATSYAWTLPTGATIASGSGTNSITVDFGSTSGNVEVTPNNICGNGGSNSKGITIQAGPIVNTSSTDETCALNDGTATATGGGTYLWDDPGTQTTATAVGLAAGNYNVVVTNNGCSSPANVVVTYNCPGPNIYSQHCNRTLPKEKSFTNCVQVPGATQYEFQIEDQGTGSQISSVVRNNSYFNFSHLTGWSYNTTYDVSARAFVGGVWTNYGISCPVTTSATPIPKIYNQHCNRTLTSDNVFTNCTKITNATQYEFQIEDQGTGSQISSVVRNNSYFNFSHLTGWLYNTTYDVSARAFIGGSWTAYGPSCPITSSGIPIVYIYNQHCNRTLATDKIFTNCTKVTNATQYEFQLVDPGTGSQIATRVSGSSYFNLSQMSNWLLSTTYDVSARAFIQGSWTAYGPSCPITTPASARMANPNTDESEFIQVVHETNLGMKIYPNPGQGEFVYLELQGLLSNSELVVTDIFGKTVLNQQVNADYGNYYGTLRFDKKLDAGFYLITVVSGNKKITKKLIVQ